MFDSFNREISYIRISVTDRCNLRCYYCMPKKGISHFQEKEILSFDEITEVVKVCTSLGIRKVRLTGGEPLVRKNIVKLVEMIARIPDVEDLSMTTNGVLLGRMAKELAAAGLKRVNVSLDTVDKDKFRLITGKDMLGKVLEGIDLARKAGLNPIKINCVVMKNDQENLSEEVKDFAKAQGLAVRYIRQMNLKTGEFHGVKGGNGGICQVCNRIRMTANGMIKPCLFSDFGYDIKKLGIEKAILMAVSSKPDKGTLNRKEEFYTIGG